MRTILDEIGEPALLEQLAEECTELAHAALKRSRLLRGENPTPVSKRETRRMIKEEYTDVILCADLLGLKPSDYIRWRKISRWHERLKEAGKDER